MAYRAQVIPAGFNQATAAMQQVLRAATGAASSGSAPRRRKRSASSPLRRAIKTSRGRRKKFATGARGIRAHLVKGSPEAKRHMAKLRRMVGKRR